MEKPVWSLTVRVTHWAVAVMVLLNMFNDTGYQHRVIGYFCVAVVILRILHGLQKNVLNSSRFYLPRISLIKAHVNDVFAGKAQHDKCHNPLGMLAVYIMWILIALLAFSGWLCRTDAFWGEDGPILIHQILAYLLLATVLTHVIAVLIMSKLQKQNLIKQMISSTNRQ
jgi:cytochrome b